MCKTKAPGFFARQVIYSQADRQVSRDRKRAPCRCNHPAKPVPTATQKAQTVLAVVLGIVVLASMNVILHAILIGLAILAAVATGLALTVVALTVRRHRRRRTLIPAPLPGGPPRTMVTGVTVRAINPSPDMQTRPTAARAEEYRR